MQSYLLFDSHCPKCSQLAAAIEEAAAGKVQTLSLYEEQAQKFLGAVYPEGWQHVPYLVTVDQGRVKAWTDTQLALRLGWLLGPRKAVQIWRQARQLGALPSTWDNPVSNTISRRRFLAGGVLAGAAALISQFTLPSSVAFACIPCSGTNPCSVCSANGGQLCYQVAFCCGDIYDVTNWYDCRTGEYCYSTYIGPICNCCCGTC